MLIELIFENGVTGWGESSPRPYVTGETPEMVLQTIRDIYAPILFKQDIDCLQDIERVLGLLEQQWSADATSFYHSALGACDIALLDALGRYNHESVVNILGPVLRKNI